jgi:hypothetical protein
MEGAAIECGNLVTFSILRGGVADWWEISGSAEAGGGTTSGEGMVGSGACYRRADGLQKPVALSQVSMLTDGHEVETCFLDIVLAKDAETVYLWRLQGFLRLSRSRGLAAAHGVGDEREVGGGRRDIVSRRRPSVVRNHV